MKLWMDGNHIVNNQCIHLNLVNKEFIETKEVLHNSLLWQGDIKFDIMYFVILQTFMVTNDASYYNILKYMMSALCTVSVCFHVVSKEENRLPLLCPKAV